MAGSKPATLAINRALYLEMAALGREATRVNPPADPMVIGRFWATLAEIDRQVIPGVWRVEVWGDLGFTDPRTNRQRWRLLVGGVGTSYQPASRSDLEEWRPDLMRHEKIGGVIRSFFANAPVTADLEIAPWAPYVPTYPEVGWLWVRTKGDTER